MNPGEGETVTRGGREKLVFPDTHKSLGPFSALRGREAK